MSTVLHPNGFIQHDLSPGVRLHIWSPDLPQAQKVYTPIHDHAFWFESQVMIGKLVHKRYKLMPLPGATHRVYAVEGALLVPTDEVGFAYLTKVDTLLAGETYEFGGPGKYHVTEGEGLTVTVMRKTHSASFSTPRVLVPKHQEPDNDFRRDQYDEALLKSWVRPVLRYLNWKDTA